MDENSYREQMDKMADMTKEAMIDAFAEFCAAINSRKYDDAALLAHSIAAGLAVFSQGLATEALARRLDKPE